MRTLVFLLLGLAHADKMPAPPEELAMEEVTRGGLRVLSSINADLDGDKRSDLVLFVGKGLPTKIYAYMRTTTGMKKVFENVTFFSSFKAEDHPKGFGFSYEESDRGFAVHFQDQGDAKEVFSLRFRWEAKDFRLVSTTTRTEKHGKCSVDTDWIAGKRTERGPGPKARVLSVPKTARLLEAGKLKLEADPIAFCG